MESQSWFYDSALITYFVTTTRSRENLTGGDIGNNTRSGEVGAQRVPLPTDFIRGEPEDTSESALITRLLKRAAKTLADDEIAVLDAEFPLKELLEVGMKRFCCGWRST